MQWRSVNGRIPFNARCYCCHRYKYIIETPGNLVGENIDNNLLKQQKLTPLKSCKCGRRYYCANNKGQCEDVSRRAGDYDHKCSSHCEFFKK